jgi:hypothetical protein
MKAGPNDHKAEASERTSTPPADHVDPDDGLDLELLDDSLAKTPWERMLANDDALRFAESLRDAMEKRNAEPKRIDAPPR